MHNYVRVDFHGRKKQKPTLQSLCSFLFPPTDGTAPAKKFTYVSRNEGVCVCFAVGIDLGLFAMLN